jgi:tripartite ATP-independent transporter DctM subunit
LDPVKVGVLSFGVLLLLLAMRMPLAFVLPSVGLIGLSYFLGVGVALTTVVGLMYGRLANYTWTVLPLFVLMGFIASNLGLAKDAYTSAHAWLRRVPGGLAIATTFAAAAFATVCGSTSAAAAALSRICVPEMERYGYKPRLSAACVVCVGPLAGMIPPSMSFVLYGMVTEQSIGKLLIAGIVPGVVSMIVISLSIAIRVKRDPSLAPMPGGSIAWREKFRSLSGLLGVGTAGLSIIVGIYTGVFTPTEAGGVGVAIVAIVGLAARRFSWRALYNALMEGAEVSAIIFGIIIGVFVYMGFLAHSGLPSELAEAVVGLRTSPLVILFLILLLYLVMGMFLEGTGILLLGTPIIFPVVTALGFDPIWFGVFTVVTCEIGVITPPVGCSIYVVKAALPHVPFEEILYGIVPFVACHLIVIGLLVAFPALALWLPGRM